MKFNRLKAKNVILQFVLAAAFLFAVLYPSLDGLHHLEKEMSERHCEHQYAEGKNEISHSHHPIEKCFACEFTFGQFIAGESIHFIYRHSIFHSGKILPLSREIAQFFRGSRFVHRGPPTFIA